MNVPENDEESRVGTGSHERLFNDRRGWLTTPDPALTPQYPSSTPQDDWTYMKFLQDYIHYPSDYYHLPPNSLSNDPQLGSADIGPTNTTTGFPDVEESSSNPPTSGHQDHPEEVASSLPSGSQYFENLLVRHTKFCVNRPLMLSA
jgi:hypothetical protein